MKKLLIVLGLMACAALLEVPDDYNWPVIDQDEPVQISDTMYDWTTPAAVPASGNPVYLKKKAEAAKI